MFLYLRMGRGEAPGRVLGALGEAGEPCGGYTVNHISCPEPRWRGLFFQQTLRMCPVGLWMSDTELLTSRSSQSSGKKIRQINTPLLGSMVSVRMQQCWELWETEEGPLHQTDFPIFLSCAPCHAFSVCFMNSFTNQEDLDTFNLFFKNYNDIKYIKYARRSGLDPPPSSVVNHKLPKGLFLGHHPMIPYRGLCRLFLYGIFWTHFEKHALPFPCSVPATWLCYTFHWVFEFCWANSLYPRADTRIQTQHWQRNKLLTTCLYLIRRVHAQSQWESVGSWSVVFSKHVQVSTRKIHALFLFS